MTGPPPRRPTYGVVSVLIPVLISTVALVLDRNPRLGDGLNGYAGMFLVAFLYIVIAGGGLAGTALGVLALVRGERLRVLGAIGVVVNIAVTTRLMRGH